MGPWRPDLVPLPPRRGVDASGQVSAIRNTLDSVASASATAANGGRPIEAKVMPDQITAQVKDMPPVTGEATVTLNPQRVIIELNSDMLKATSRAKSGVRRRRCRSPPRGLAPARCRCRARPPPPGSRIWLTMRDWPKTLRRASFAGVSFHVDDEAVPKTGRRVVVHEYSKAETHDTEDMGRLPREFRVKAYIADDQADANVARLIDACSRPGEFTLVLPFFRPQQVRCTGCAPSHRKDRLGYVEIDLEFVEARGDDRVGIVAGPASCRWATASPPPPSTASPTRSRGRSPPSCPTRSPASSPPCNPEPPWPRPRPRRSPARPSPPPPSAGRSMPWRGACRCPPPPRRPRAHLPPGGADFRPPGSHPADAGAIAATLVGVVRAWRVRASPRTPLRPLSAAAATQACVPSSASPVLTQAYALARALCLSVEAACLGEAFLAEARTGFADRACRRPPPAPGSARRSTAPPTGSRARSARRPSILDAAARETCAFLVEEAASLQPVIRVTAAASFPAASLAWSLYADPERAAELLERNGVATPFHMPATFEAVSPER